MSFLAQGLDHHPVVHGAFLGPAGVGRQLWSSILASWSLTLHQPAGVKKITLEIKDGMTLLRPFGPRDPLWLLG